MTPQEIQDVYNDLSQVPQNTATQATTELGQSQAARGTSLAQMGASGGNGIGNYTYNRVIDPTVQQLATQLVTTGRSQALNRAIILAQQQASENYQKAYNNYVNRQRARARASYARASYARASYGSGTGTVSSGNGSNGKTSQTITGVTETAEKDGPTSSGTNLNDVRLNYDEKGNLISASFPNTHQTFYAPALNNKWKSQQQGKMKELFKQTIENNRQFRWSKQHPFSGSAPSWFK